MNPADRLLVACSRMLVALEPFLRAYSSARGDGTLGPRGNKWHELEEAAAYLKFALSPEAREHAVFHPVPLFDWLCMRAGVAFEEHCDWKNKVLYDSMMVSKYDEAANRLCAMPVLHDEREAAKRFRVILSCS